MLPRPGCDTLTVVLAAHEHEHEHDDLAVAIDVGGAHGHTVCTVESWSRRHPVGTVAAEVIEPPFLNPDGMAPKQSTTR